MKHLLLSFIATFFYCSWASGQSYVAFPTEDASWKTIRCFYFYPPDGYDVLTYDQSGDTVITGTSYHKLYLTFHHLPGSTNDTAYTNYYGAIREDQKKIYVMSYDAFGDYTERLMYDFNAQNVGDTVTTNLLNWGDPIVVKSIVSAIDSVEIDGTFHRRLHFNTIDGYPTPENWIEGIGSNFGLAYASFYLVTDNSYDLRCFTTENVHYQNNQLLLSYCGIVPPVDCEISTQAGMISNLRHFTLFPNPATGILHVQVTTPVMNGMISLFDALGRVVLQMEISTAMSSLELNIQDLKPGVYWTTLTNEAGLFERMPVIVQ